VNYGRPFKRKRKRNGKVQQDRCYSFRYKLDGEGWKTMPLHVTELRAAEVKLRKIVERMEREEAGLIVPAEQRQAAKRPLSEHLADYLAHLKTHRRNKQYRSDVRGRVTRLIQVCGWKRVKDVTPESFEKWRAKQTTISVKTQNDYLAAIYGLLQWMVDGDRISVNPMKVKPIDGRGQQTFERRAISEAEFQRLLDVAGKRRVVYLFAVFTSYRRSTIYALRWGDVDLDAERPSVVAGAWMTKNKTAQRMPLRDDLAAELNAIKPDNAKPNDRVFAGLLPRVGLDFMRSDLEKAGIPFDNGCDQRFDFHALRHQGCTWAGATGYSGEVLRRYTSHKSESQVRRYVHADHMPVREIIERMPRFTGGTQIGTHEKAAEGRNQSEAVGNNGQQEKRERPQKPHKKSPGTPRYAEALGVDPKYPQRDLNPCLQDENLVS